MGSIDRGDPMLLDELDRARELRVAIVEALGDGFIRTDADGTIIEVNEAFCRMVGYDTDEVIGLASPHPWWRDDQATRALEAARLALLPDDPHRRAEFEGDLVGRDGGRLRVAADIAVLRSPDGEVVGTVGTIKDVSERAAADELAERVTHLTEQLAPQLHEDEVLDMILDGVFAAVEPTGVGLLLPTGDGTALAPRRHRGLGWSEDEPPLPLEADLPPTRAFREGTAFFFADRGRMLEEFPDVRPLLNERDHHARASLPLRGRHGPTAVLHVLFPSVRSFTRQQRSFLRDVADRCGLALERAGLYEAQRREAERARELQLAFAELAGVATPAAVAHIVLHQAVPALGGRAGSISLLDETGSELRLLSHAGFDEASAGGWDVLPIGERLPGADAVRERAAIYLGDRDAIADRYPDQLEVSRRAGDRAWAALPLMHGVEPLGLLFVNFVDPQPFDDPQRLSLETMADRAASAIDRARKYTHEHVVAVTLQHSLLPADLVSRPSVKIATRYEAGAEGLDVGGDWYDAVGLPDGRIALTVGDVVGRGLAAAATMGHLRSALRALALRGAGPSDVLQGLDDFAQAASGTHMATVAYAELQPTTGELTYACAGHPPPVLLPRSGRPRLLEDGRSPMLEVQPGDQPRSSATVRLSEGDAIVLYTDGLTERRDEPLETGLHRLLEALAGAGGSEPEAICDLLLHRVAAPGSRVDDVALLCARFQGVTSHVVTVPARAEALATVRAAVDAWLEDLHPPSALREDLVLAVSEASANAVEHAYRRGRTGEITIEGTKGRDVVLRVIDRGSWRGSGGDPSRGRGMHIMRSLVNDMEVERRADGTTIILRRSLGRGGEQRWT
ncbi:MAG: SpoIIE family protein phosphatase [Actinomycetota bacterium]